MGLHFTSSLPNCLTRLDILERRMTATECSKLFLTGLNFLLNKMLSRIPGMESGLTGYILLVGGHW